MQHRTFRRLALCLALMTGFASAQTIIGYDSAVAGFEEMITVSPAYPGGAPWQAFPSLAAAPPSGLPLGAVAMNNTTGILYATDGTVIEPSNYPFYPVAAPAPPPFPWVPPPAPGPGMLMGPIQGMTIDPLGAPGGLLWVTDGFVVVGVAPVPGNPVIVPPFAVGFPLVAPPLVGLDWDPFTGTLWAVDVGGALYNFAPGGGFIGVGPPIPPLAIGAGPASGLALDRGGPGPGTGFYVSYPGVVIEYLSASPIPTGALPMPQGLTFHGIPAPLFGAGTCSAIGMAQPQLRANSAAWSGNAAFALRIGGFTVGTPVQLLVDFGFNALIPGGTPFGPGVLYLDPFTSPTLGIIPLGPQPPGGFIIPVPLVGPPGTPPTPPGFRVYIQALALECTTAPFYALTDGMQFEVCAP